MRARDANSQRSAPRLIGISAIVLGTLVLLLMGLSSGASAAVGPTDLALTKSDSPDPVVVGNDLTYAIQVRNTGVNDASGVAVTDTLPSQVDYVSSSTTPGTCQRVARTVTCDLGRVDAGTAAMVTIVVKARKTGAISNTASVASVDDTNTANNQDSEPTIVNKKPKPKKVMGSCATPTITGTIGDDVLVGTAGADVIVSYSGDDQVYSGAGKDLICSGSGSDLVVGGTGGDTAIGGKSPDRLIGGDGGDLLKGKAGRDKLRGQRGNDVLNGGRKRDSCKGGAGRDTLIKCP